MEGVFGGVIISSTISFLYANYLLNDVYISLLLVVFASISSVFGDLYESKLKCEAGVKDSGNILPGHGGILDRIDGFLFAAPVLYILLTIFR